MPYGRKIHDAGDFTCLTGEREKECLGGRLPLNAGELIALQGGEQIKEQVFVHHGSLGLNLFVTCLTESAQP